VNAAALARNPKAVAGAGAVGDTVVLALRARAKKAAGGADGGGASVQAIPATGSGRYDSTASDVYNSLQPELESLQAQISALGAVPSSPVQALDPAAAVVPAASSTVTIQPIKSPVAPTQAPSAPSAPPPGFSVPAPQIPGVDYSGLIDLVNSFGTVITNIPKDQQAAYERAGYTVRGASTAFIPKGTG
jgi:hypothetical protein